MTPSSPLDIRAGLAALSGADLMADLAIHAKLPEEGCLAGQALASAAMKRLGIFADGPVNDIDVFAPIHTERGAAMARASQNGRHAKLGKLAHHITESRGYAGADNYRAMLDVTLKEGYAIVTTSREGMLNEVAFNRIRSEPGVSDAMAVIKGFDMNCVQVGLDLATGRLEWTPAFEAFLATWQLRVEHVNTPFHTAIRYFKKKSSLECYGDDELNMATCSLPWIRKIFSEVRVGESNLGQVAGRYGSKAHADYEALGELISPWMREVRCLRVAPLWTMEPAFAGRESALAKLVELSDPQMPQSGSAPPREATSMMLTHAAAWCEAALRPQSKAHAARMDKFKAAIEGTEAHASGKKLIVDYARVKGRAGLGAEDLSGIEAQALAELAGGHELVACAMGHFTPKEQAAAALRLRERARELGGQVYGWIEGAMTRDGGADLILADAEALRRFCEERAAAEKAARALASKPLNAPLELEAMSALAVRTAREILMVEFEELLTHDELTEEGASMRHCVGGYSEQVRSGASRIFKVKGAASIDRATMELRIQPREGDKPDSVQLKQIRGLANREPGPAAKAAAEMIASSGDEAEAQLHAMHVAAALAPALDNKAVPEKSKAKARAVLLAGLLAARGAGPRGKRSAERIQEALTRHFPLAAKAAAADPSPLTAARGPSAR